MSDIISIFLTTNICITSVCLHVNVRWAFLYTLLPSYKWIIWIMQLAALHKPSIFTSYNHSVYQINTHRHALEQLSQDCMVKLWPLNVYCTHDGCWLQCFTTTYIVLTHWLVVQNLQKSKNQCTYTCSNTALKRCSHLIFHIKI